jgi:hypothetical protein
MQTRSIVIWAALLGAIVPSSAGAQPTPPPAQAQPAAPTRPSPGGPKQPPPALPGADVKAAARAAADRGQQLFDAGQYAEAIAAFQEADKIFHAPTFTVMIARAQDRLGRLLEARATYEQILAEQLAHYAPTAFFDAQAAARKELDALVPRIPTLQVFVTGVPTSTAQLTVDGASAPIGQPLPRNPGEHAFTASASGRVSVTQKLTLQEGAATQVTVALAPLPPPAPEKPPASPSPPPPLKPEHGAPATPERGYLVPAIAAFGAAGVAVAVGTITGAMSTSRVSTLEDRCPDHTCYDDTADPYDSAHTLATVSTVSFAVGGVAVAAGVTLLLWPRGDQRTAQVSMTVAPGWLALKGGF